MSQEANAGKQDLIFSLDIGTRSVVGLIVEPVDDKFRVVDCCIQEHDERSMLDGQIHDVVAVARVIEKIKQTLEASHGPLSKVAVAAAGRSLRTRRVSVEIDIRHQAFLSREDVITLEFSAVQEAQSQLAIELNETDVTRYYCVGYSVVNYFLDGEMIGSLIDQRGETARVDVIATFLPRVVVDSLLAALKRCDLEMQALTLEPIAAINVLIPVTMRRLNIALVDIGAGTSDVALTEEGAITAYGMVPVAGDEITDALMNAFLVDFPMAEEVKRKLSTESPIPFTDILGLEHLLSADEIIAAIDPEIERLASKIADKITELNGKSPQAVMLIGGGSLTPRLPEKVAALLNMPAQRVAVRGADAIAQHVGTHPLLNGPEFVTPVGIAVAARRHPIKYVTVTVNESVLRIFDLRKMTLGDAVLAAGLDVRRLYGRPGLAMTLTVNGRMKIIPGGHGTPPVIMKNNEPVGLDAPIADGDAIIVVPGENGQQASACVKDLLDMIDTLDVSYNEQPFSLEPLVLVNGTAQPLDYSVADRDEVIVRLRTTVDEVLAALAETGATVVPPSLDGSSLAFSLNGHDYTVPFHESQLLVNGQSASGTTRVRTGDNIVHRVTELPAPTIQDVIPLEDWVQEELKVVFNGQPVTIKTASVSITMDGEPAAADHIVKPDAVINVKTTVGAAPVFNDVFRYVEVSLTQPASDGIAKLIMLVNGEPATFQTEIKSGDKLELYWES
ncbi:cell division protein FtsA [Brevibacillus fluminis]|uniref:Cell division protein FtsA n=1 Tax=Brevibacillus fluminis TaxID=511487 RepID=A0A3M8DH71_9BACL|nr:cell division FtsA domain-containing protein [Brevibacillus fluminis]RNB87450.1 cell division protein FtsA [Brevibacillus fluminis]